MKSYLPIRLLCLLHALLWLVSSQANAQPVANASKNQTIGNISSICLTSPFDCLAHVDAVLNILPKNSRAYFEVLQYKLEALFNLQQIPQLYQETKQWLDQPNVPMLFQITNTIYFAKAAIASDEYENSRKYYQVAKSLLGQLNQEYPSPIRLVQFANLQMQLNEHQNAYQLMLNLASKYPNSPDTRFMTELHGNLGHAANQLGYTKKALKHWQDTVKWVELFGNKQQIAVVYFNLADIYDQLNDYQNAAINFKNAISLATQAGDAVKTNQARFHLIQILISQQQFCQAQAVHAELDTSKLPTTTTYQVKLEQLILGCE